MNETGDKLTSALGLDPDQVKVGHDLAQINNPEVSGLIFGVMDKNAREAQWIQDQIREGDEREIQRWKERALRAESELDAVRHNITGLLYPSEAQIARLTDHLA